MPGMRSRLPLVLLALLAALAVLAGCGGAGATFSAEDLAEAVDTTVAKGGAKIAIESQATLPGTGQLTISGGGAIDARAQRGQLTLKATDAPDLPAGIDKDDLTQEVVFDKFLVYLRSPSFAPALKEGKEWVKIDLAEAGKAADVDLGALAQSGQDPTQSLRLLKAVSGDVEKVGEEQVRGVSTTRYKATIDLKKYPDTVPAKDRAAARATIDSLTKALGTSTSPIEVWIGEDDLVRRFAQSLKLKSGEGASSIRQRLELYDYGTDVEVTVPPADEVQDLTDLASAGIRGSKR